MTRRAGQRKLPGIAVTHPAAYAARLAIHGDFMSFRIFIYYCALCGGWAAFLGWAIGLFLSPSTPLGNVGIRGMWLGMFVAFGLGLVDALWNLSLTQAHVIGMRVGVAVLV